MVIALIVGLLVGGFLGMLFLALVVAAGKDEVEAANRAAFDSLFSPPRSIRTATNPKGTNTWCIALSNDATRTCVRGDK